MGRIADALKKAQIEREEKLRIGAAIGAPVLPTNTIDVVSPPEPAMRESRASPRKNRREQGINPAEAFHRPIPVAPSRAGPAPMSPLPSWDISPLVVTMTERDSPVAEQFRAVRTWLMSRVSAAERCCYAITSSIAQEGKSVAAANLAVSLAEVRHLQVMVVDADLRGGGLGKLFKMPDQPGLADVLAGRCPLADAIQSTPIPNLSFMPAGVCGELKAAELFSTRAASVVFEDLRARYHYVLIDAPAVQRSADIGVIGTFCTGIVMVVRMHKTPTQVVQQSVRWLQSHNLNVVGCIAAGQTSKSAGAELHVAGA